MRQHSLPSTTIQPMSRTHRGSGGSRAVGRALRRGYHTMPAATGGDGKVQEKSVAGGLDVENGYDKLAAGGPLMSRRAKVS